MSGKIYMIPNLLGESDPINNIPLGVMQQIYEIKVFIVENIRSARRYLIKINYPLKSDEITFYEMNKHNAFDQVEKYIKICLSGINIGIISESGMPGIADPGSLLVRLGHKNNIEIVPLTGPSSIFLALAASGLNGQNFLFHGYLPIQKKERIKKIKELENKVKIEKQSQIFIETPYRNMSLLSDIVGNCHPSTQLCVACEVSTKQENIRTQSISSWKARLPDLHKKPCVFILGT